MQQKQKGFTLIELLVVVSIIAILSVFVILTLNPAQMLKQARDSQRISDLGTLKSAIALYLSDVSTPSMGSANICYISSVSGVGPATAGCGGRMAAADVLVSSTTLANSASTTGLGWIPINFTAISFGSPLGAEPDDPVNNATYFYSYASNASLQFEIDAKMESTKYAASGTSDIESIDGGSNPTVYEVGTNLTL
jgi:prepilin-type N-terminal cleavage/methylation domain-containing protein